MSKQKKQQEKAHLKLGKMTSKELAKWFGVSYQTYCHKIPAYLRDLELFCWFEPVYGGAIIKEIYTGCETYNKYYDPDFERRVIEIIQNAPQGYGGPNTRLISQIGIAKQIDYEMAQGTPDADLPSLRQTQTKVKRVCEDLLGKPDTKKTLGYPGKAGSRKFVWAIRMSEEPNDYRPLTNEEYACFRDLLKAALTSEKHLQEIEELAQMEDAYKCGEVSEEEYTIAKKNYRFDFQAVLSNFSDVRRSQIVRITEAELLAAWGSLTYEGGLALREARSQTV